MAKLHSDVLDGGIDDANGVITHRRKFTVENVVGAGSVRFWNALNTPGLPLRGDAHPVIPRAKVVDRRVELVTEDDNSVFTVEVTYSDTGASASQTLSLSDPVEVNFSLQTIADSVIRDRRGKLMQTEYLTNALSFTTSTHRVDIDRPASLISITKTVRTRPDELNDLYGGKVNDDNWSRYSRYKVRCEGFSGFGDGRGLWRVTGEFFPSPSADRTWRATVTTREGSTIPNDVRIGNGQARYEPYQLARLSRSGFVI